MQGQGTAIFGVGIAEGENRAADAAYNAINNPMLEDSKIDGAKNLLVNIASSEEITLAEVGEICKTITASADKEYNMFWGQVTQPELEGKISVTVIATGFEKKGNSFNAVTATKDEEEPVITETKLPEDVVGMNELDAILNGGKVGPTANSTGDFVSKKDIKADDSKEEVEKGALSRCLFDDDDEVISKPLNNRFAPPEDFVSNSDDINQPAIWKKSGWGRTIKLTDD